MFTKHVTHRLAAHLEGQLAPAEARQVERHLFECARCRGECEDVKLGLALVKELPLASAPEAIWSSLQARSYKPPTIFPWRWALVASVLLALVGVTYVAYPKGPHWNVVWLDGGSPGQIKTGRIRAGQWLETDAKSRARVEVGSIGSVEVTPNTRVRVLTTRPDEHRLSLARGEIRAKISAPPKLFFVETASGTTVDLGCEYDLKADDLGLGVLRVTRGWVSYQWKGSESLVPAGASCPTRPKVGPGIPYFDDAPERLKRAADAFAFDKGGTGALAIILSQARVRDTLTLWHLLSRVPGADRERVFHRMAELSPTPAGVSRELVLRLDSPTLDRWREDLAWKW